MPAHKASPIELSVQHEHELNALVRARSTPQKLAERARIILLAAGALGLKRRRTNWGSGARPPAPGAAVGWTRRQPPAWPRV
jgi:hypothetical protein